MTPAARVKLLILLLLPALSVPRGTRLDWCICSQPVEASCCSDCCGDEALDGPVVEDPRDSGCCKQLVVEDFDEILTTSVVKVPAQAASCAPPTLRLAGPVRLAARRPDRRVPPHVPPPGLRPGAAPLRL